MNGSGSLAWRDTPAIPEPARSILIYQSEDGRTKLDVRLEDQTVWLSQKQLTELFGKAKGTISEHIKHIFEDEELDRRQLFGIPNSSAGG